MPGAALGAGEAQPARDGGGRTVNARENVLSCILQVVGGLWRIWVGALETPCNLVLPLFPASSLAHPVH